MPWLARRPTSHSAAPTSPYNNTVNNNRSCTRLITPVRTLLPFPVFAHKTLYVKDSFKKCINLEMSNTGAIPKGGARPKVDLKREHISGDKLKVS